MTLKVFIIASLMFFSSLCATYADMKAYVLSNAYKKISLMTDQEFDEFCEDAENCPAKGYRDSQKAAKEASEYEENVDYDENPDHFRKK